MEDTAQSSATPMIELHGDEFWPLSGRPYFDIILTKSHVKPIYQMEIPTTLDPNLPAGTSVPMVLSFGENSWEMTYNETKRLKLVDRHSWKAFVDDNSLKAGDGCIFELMGSVTVQKYCSRSKSSEVTSQLS
ncbi:PREDICTED: B3 domain-containing protein Os04g0386900-like [Fragaria vesca subsp. vesca]|uniref:B3 domain-containing protein Os04g0386900-like n=1 Tax=Fragaria vesca subsp. vesca TaxID=101020 RepID=UPI0002C2DC83|nr:PREDICTED: B3 domain-containing protein Os04g0386900-like [Fragaria vesca subsp. vesca]